MGRGFLARALVQQLHLALPGVRVHEAGNGGAPVPASGRHCLLRTCMFVSTLLVYFAKWFDSVPLILVSVVHFHVQKIKWLHA